MRFKLDENLPAEAAGPFRRQGFDCTTVEEEHLSGAADPRIIQACRAEGRILVTLDVGFGNIQSYPPSELPGIVVLRLRRQDKTTVLSVLSRLIETLAERRPEHQLWVVSEEHLRVRE